MARFYGEIQGSRGSASRLGTASSGMSGHLRGWDVGCRVEVATEDGVDTVWVWRTGGSNGARAEELIAKYQADGPTTLLPNAWGTPATV